jgi:hypothetical protein
MEGPATFCIDTTAKKATTESKSTERGLGSALAPACGYRSFPFRMRSIRILR